MKWLYRQYGDQVYHPAFLASEDVREALEKWLEEEGVELTTANKKKILKTQFWQDRLDLVDAATALHHHLGDDISNDFNAFEESVKAAAKKLKLNLSAPQLKAILDAVSWRDPLAKPIVKTISQLSVDVGFDFESARCFCSHMEGGTCYEYESDTELRDTENVPFTYFGTPGKPDAEEAIAAYFQKEVLPHVPDAWVELEKTVIGYEISFNKYFYVHQPLRDLVEVVQEIRALEKETEGLLEKILDFAPGQQDKTEK